jgi:ribosome-associated translation inhibitor RaiA
MNRPLEVFFRNMKPSPELEADIRARAARLDRMDRHIIGCRVTVELENHTHKTGYIPQVHIQIEVPGRAIMVNHRHEQGAEALTAVREAFDAAAKQLQEYTARKTLHLKHHEPAIKSATE